MDGGNNKKLKLDIKIAFGSKLERSDSESVSSEDSEDPSSSYESAFGSNSERSDSESVSSEDSEDPSSSNK